MRLHLLVLLIVVSVVFTRSASGRESVPTFNKDIAPIFFAKCSSCHRSGEVGPFSLLSYADAKKRANQLARITESKIMPPWKPDPGVGEFKFDRTLTDQQIATFKQWAAAGAPEGEARDLPPQPKFPQGWHLGQPDMILKLKQPYKIPAEGPDIYVHFVFPMKFENDKYLRAVQVLPSNRRAAHHGVVLLDGSGTARKLADKHDGQSYPNFGGPGFPPRGALPGYAPGMTTRIDDSSEAGLTLAKGLDVVLQMHYHPTGKEEVDEPAIGLYFTDVKPARGANLVLMANNDVHIPPGEHAYKRSDSFKLPVDFKVENIWGHMHMIGKKIEVWAELPSGERKDLMQISDWNYNWQDTYFYKKPFILPKGTVLKSEWTWDNTEAHPRNPNNPPKLVTWGEGSADEMSGLLINGVTVNPGWDEGVMWLTVIGHYFEVEGKANEAKAKREKQATQTADPQFPGAATKDLTDRPAVASSASPDKQDPEPLPKGWESRFNTGRQRPKYDPKTGVLTLVYDFSNPNQLKDFEASAGAEPEVSKGILALKGTESVKHIVGFKTMNVSVAFVAGKGDSKVMTTTGGFGLGVREFFGEYIDMYIGDRRCAEYHAEGNLKFIKTPVTVQWTIDGAKTGLLAGSADIRAKTEGQDAGQLELLAGTHPNYYQALTISGVVDQKWMKKFFAK